MITHREIKVASVQPPGGDFFTTSQLHGFTQESVEYNEYVVTQGIKLAQAAAQQKVDIICLPELFSIFGLDLDDIRIWVSYAKGRKNAILHSIQKIAKAFGCYIALPILELTDNSCFYNTVLLINRQGNIIGKYRKVHVTEHERRNGILPGNEYPVFETDFGRIGIMVCWDAFFPEVARVLMLKGAEILLFPRWISGPSEITHEIMIRARAIDCNVHIISSSYGIEQNKAWRPGMLFGRSRVIAPDGTIIADCGRQVGYVVARIDLDKKVLMDVSDKGGDVQDLKILKLRSRRPDTYKAICEMGSSPCR